MKKSLLLGLMAAATLSASALEEGAKVYNHTGRFQISAAENLISNSTFADGFDGWAAISATEGRTPGDQFAYAGADEATGAPAGIKATYSEPTEGISYSVTSLDANTTYIVSMKVWAPETTAGTTNFNTRLGETFDDQTYANSVQKVNIVGTDVDGAAVEFGFPTEIKPGENVLTWAIVGDGTARTYDIKLAGWNTNLVISEVAVQQADQIGDTRKLQEMSAYLQAVNGMVDGGLSSDLQELIDGAEAVIQNDDATQEDVDGAMETINDSFADAIAGKLDDYLPNANDKLPKAASKVSKVGSIGNWKDDANRIHSAAGDYYDLGHFQYSSGWGNAGSGGRIGLVNYGMDLVKGTYIFAVDLKANAREFVKNAWSINEGLQFADGIISVVDANDAENKVEIATTGRYAIAADGFTKNWVVFTVPADGKYDIRIDTYAKEAYDGIKSGSVVFPFGASLYAKTAAAYTKAQLDYENDVLGQVKAGRDAITKAEGYLKDETKSWGKDALQAALTDYVSTFEGYEKMTEDEIIATYDAETYDGSAKLEDVTQDGDYKRMLASEVYFNCVKQLLAANTAFEDQNAKIDGLTAAIANAETTRDSRLYSTATGKDVLTEAVAVAAEEEKNLRSVDYSDENATAVDDAIAALNEALDVFKATIPAENITTVVDMTSALSAEIGEADYMVYSDKENGFFNVSSFSEDPNGNTSFGIGYVVNEENMFPTLMRVGNGSANLDFVAEGDGVLLISFDYYFGNLTTKYAGFLVQKAVTTETEEGTKTDYETICGLDISKYDGKANLNTFDIDFNGKIDAVGSSSAANDAIAAETNKTHFEVMMDLGTKMMSCTTSGNKGTTASQEIAFEGAPSRFVVKSDYNNADRRSFFGNLTIKTVKVDASGVNDVEAATVAKAAAVKTVANGQVIIKTAKGTFNAAGAQIK